MIAVKGNGNELIDKLKAGKNEFSVASTISSKMVDFQGVKYIFSDSHFSKKYLRLFAALKREVNKNIKEKELIVPKFEKSKYFHFKEFEKIEVGQYETFSNCYELDINKAYYSALFLFGYISEEFFNMCIELPKKIRLALVGSLATQKTILYYEEGKIKSHEVKDNETLRRVFFQLVAYIDKCLYSFAGLSKDNFLFYWVDGIFLQAHEQMNDNLNFIKNQYELDFSVELMKKIIIYCASEKNTHIAIAGTEKETRVFSLPNVFIKN